MSEANLERAAESLAWQLRGEAASLDMDKTKRAILAAMKTVVADLLVELDPPVCRLQFPDGSVPGNAREAAEGWKRFYDETIIERDNAGKALDENWISHQQLVAMRAERDKLQAFKDWVHAYLDTHGVPHHPPGTHGAAGCRIGDRMDWLMAAVSELKEATEEAFNALTTCTQTAEESIVYGKIKTKLRAAFVKMGSSVR